MRTPRALLSVPALCLITFGAGGLSTARADEPAPPAPKVLQHLHASGDFIDDPFALSEDGTRLAWITTDGATRAELHIATVGDEKSAKAFKFDSITPERVQFLDKDRVIVVDRNPSTQMAHAEVFGPKGSLMKFPLANDVGVGNAAGVPSIVTWQRTESPDGTKHTFNAWRADNFKPIGKKVLVENRDGRVAFARSLYKPLYFLDGFGTLVGQKEGEYDKKKDIRKPELAAKADLFGNKMIEEKELKDVVAFADFSTNLRKLHNNETHFIAFWPDRSTMSHVNGELFPSDAVASLTPTRPLRKYDPATLLYRPTPDGNLTVSLTIDPVNPEAVKAQKADKDWLDIYHLDVKSHTLTPLIRIDGMGRPSRWWLSGNRLALLRKHKGFGRGGSDLDVLEIGPEAPRASPAVSGKDGVPAKSEAVAPAGDKVVTPAKDSGGAKK